MLKRKHDFDLIADLPYDTMTMLPIRSYVRRQGRMIPAQKRALEELWQVYGVPGHGLLEPAALFGRQAPCYVEIGFGMGDALLEMARVHPHNNYLGIEVHLPGVGRTLLRLHEMGLANVRIDRRDAMEVLECLPACSLAGVYLFFPDPWSKPRHRKRRLVQPLFVEKLRRVLAPGGLFHAATDWEEYARHIQGVMEDAGGFSCRTGDGSHSPCFVERPTTRFEQRGLRRGHAVRDLLFDRL